MKKQTMLAIALCLTPSMIFAQEELEGTQHQINYGLIGLDNFGFIDMDTSVFPVLGFVYRYSFEPLKSENAPYEIISDMERINWLEIDFNAFTGVAPNIGGHFYLSNQWSIEADLIYDRETYTSDSFSARNEDILTDLVVNYQLNNKWQVGLGVRHWAEFSKLRSDIDEINDQSRSASESNIVLQGRYTNINDHSGFDTKFSASSSDDENTLKILSTYYTSRKNGLAFGLTHKREKRDSRFGYYDTNHNFTFLSFAHKYWFSENTAIDYGIGRELGHSGAVLIDINGVWRF